MSPSVRHISRLIILLLIGRPVYSTTHFILEDHSVITEAGKFNIEEKTVRHWCEHYLHAEYKSFVLGTYHENLFRSISDRKKNLFDVEVSLTTYRTHKLYVRGPPGLSIEPRNTY